MNTRILDLIKNPELLQIEDLKLLELEIEKTPYMQSLRAIYLLGVHQFYHENFQAELTKTAAYTTDKKILYNFINQNKTEPTENEQVHTHSTEIILEEPEVVELASETKTSEQEEVIIENILSENSQTEEVSTVDTPEVENIYPIESQKEEAPTPTGIDFYTQNLNLEEENASESKIYEPKTSIIDFYAQPKNQEEVEEERLETISPISFYENPISTSLKEETIPTLKEKDNTENKVEKKNNENLQENHPTEIIENTKQVELPPAYEWKPIQLDSTPTPSPKITETSKEEISLAYTETKEETEEFLPIEEKIEITEKEEVEKVKETISTPQNKGNSNVSSFINTWQNWLKIDRTPVLTEQEKKAAIIDKFIENNPKISPIKEDVEFVVKEKSDDISHLMTETLAQLYAEQKLYTKAIKAYQILQEKYPERTADFEEKIEEIKRTRGGK